MNTVIVLLAFASVAQSFTLPRSLSRSPMMTRMSDVDDTSKVSESADAEAPLISLEATLDEISEVEVDLDALTEESSAEAESTFKPSIDISSMVADPASRVAPRQAKWFPMLLSPAPLDGSMAGDVGFDPIGFSNSPERLVWMRDAGKCLRRSSTRWTFYLLLH